AQVESRCAIPERVLLLAEDAIRSATVTGVQTCALPISAAQLEGSEFLIPVTVRRHRFRLDPRLKPAKVGEWNPAFLNPGKKVLRSEERRVGKECRYRHSRDPSTNKRASKVALRGDSNIL